MFQDRVDAGIQLARLVAGLRDLRAAQERVVVVGLPRGGVPVASEVARILNAPLDVILVRKLGVPSEPEVAMGAIGEDGVRVLNRRVIEAAEVSDAELESVEALEQAELDRRANLYRAGRPPVSLKGKLVLVVDDGIATGSTAAAACLVAKAHGADRIALAVPVAPPRWKERLSGVADIMVSLLEPARFTGVGESYADFTQTSDAQVIDCLGTAEV